MAELWDEASERIKSKQFDTTMNYPFAYATNDSVVVIFNAKEEDGGLAGFTGDVYTHTGVITDKSASSSDWKFVIGNWGDNNVQPKFRNIGEDLWELAVGDIKTFYGIPQSEKVLKFAFVFRSADTQRTGRAVGGADIFLDLFEQGLTVLNSPHMLWKTLSAGWSSLSHRTTICLRS